MNGKICSWIALPLLVALVAVAMQGMAKANTIRDLNTDSSNFKMKPLSGTINQARSLPLIIAAVDEPDTNCQALGTCSPKKR
jgi:hypothetical protein